MKIKIIVAGGRDLDDQEFADQNLDYVLSDCQQEELEFVCGEAKGADECGKRYALRRGKKVKSFPANWSLNGKAAGPIRNEEMARYADVLIAFWDGVSRGTKDMINRAQQHGLIVLVIRYKKS